MSGFQNITGFAPPTSAAGFMSLLQKAYFRGVPFSVIASSVRKGRKVAVHDYPFRDGGWAEDMGRALRTYSFIGYLVGDDAPAMQLLLDLAVETPGPGLLIHPTLGAQMVSVLSCGTAVRRETMRVIEIAFEFIEQGSQSLLTTLIATAIQVANFADLTLPAIGADLGSFAGPAAAAGSAAIGEGVAVVTSFGNACIGSAEDPGAIIGIAAGLPPVDSNSSYGRYRAGSTSSALPAGTTVASLEAAATAGRAAVAAASATAIGGAGLFSATSAPALVAQIATTVEAARATMTDPADQVRVLQNLVPFSYNDTAAGTGLPGDMATVRDAMAAACRRAALVSLARASAVYQPVSYQDAQATLESVTAALDVEITAAGDAGEDETYAAMRALRNAVVTDLTTRGATLPEIVTATFGIPLPTLVVAQILYQDASRADEISLEAAPPHPAFCPLSMQVLSNGPWSTPPNIGSLTLLPPPPLENDYLTGVGGDLLLGIGSDLLTGTP